MIHPLTLAARILLVSLLTFVGGCKESLPPRNDPADILQGTIEGLYVLTANENTLKLFLSVRNTYDETLQDTASLRGVFHIVLARDTSYQKTVALADSNLIEGTYDRISGVLTLDPNAIVRLRYTWNFIDDYGRDLREIFHYQPDPQCTDRQLALKEVFVLQGSIRVYRRTTILFPTPVSFSLCYVSNFVDPRFCPPIRTDLPCQ